MFRSVAISLTNVNRRTMPQSFQIGTNPKIVNKPNPSTVNHATDWQNTSLTLDELIQSIQDGYAFSAQFKIGYRKTTNLSAPT